jgi:hypothetical protein
VRRINPFNPSHRGTYKREADREYDEARMRAAMWALRAPSVGFCSGCGAHVDEAHGKLHDEGCIPSAPFRCQPGQRT